MIIAIEGIDGAGKRTLTEALCSAFPLPVTTLAFPRYKDSLPAALIDDALHGSLDGVADSPVGMALLFTLDRYEVREPLLEAAQDKNSVLICDRYIASNRAYTAARVKESASVEWLTYLERERLGLPAPKLQVLLTTPPVMAAERAQSRERADSARVRDRYERDDFLQARVAEEYRRLAEESWVSPWYVADHSVDNSLHVNTIIDRVMQGF